MKLVRVFLLTTPVALCFPTTTAQERASLCLPLTSTSSKIAVTEKATRLSGLITQQTVSQVRPESVVELPDSPGGVVSAARHLAAVAGQVRITGESCASACVMILVENDNVCLGPTVRRIRFHSIINSRCIDGTWKPHRVDTESTLRFIDSVKPAFHEKLRPMAKKNMVIDIPVDVFLEQYPEKRCTD